MSGIYLGGTGHVVEGIRADQNTFTIYVNGSGSIVRNNQVVATGGSTLGGAITDAYGIVVVGSGTSDDNDVIDTVPRGTGAARGDLRFSWRRHSGGGNRLTNAAPTGLLRELCGRLCS